jgi:hypothetical protein
MTQKPMIQMPMTQIQSTRSSTSSPHTGQPAISTDSLRKVYKGHAVVQGLTLKVGPG